MKNTRLFPLLLLTTVLGSVLIWSGYQFAKSQGLVGEKFSLSIQTDSGADLFQGMKVTYKGFRLGKLSQLELTPAGNVIGRVDIEGDRSSFFTQGATLKVSKEKIITSELVLIPSATNQTPIARNGSIEIVRESVANDLANRIEPLITKVHLLLEQLSDPKLGVQATLTQSRVTMNETSHLLMQINDPQHGLPQVLTHTRDTMSSAQQLVNQLNDPKSGVSPTLQNANHLMLKADGAITEVQQAPVYRWLVPTPASKEKQPSGISVPEPSK
jgi:phospholipid/cholesterol/gamma-HCH transport system substrate-binding protein